MDDPPKKQRKHQINILLKKKQCISLLSKPTYYLHITISHRSTRGYTFSMTWCCLFSTVPSIIQKSYNLKGFFIKVYHICVITNNGNRM